MSKRLKKEREGCRGQDREPGKIGEGYRDQGFKEGRAGSQEKFARALGRRNRKEDWEPEEMAGVHWGRSGGRAGSHKKFASANAARKTGPGQEAGQNWRGLSRPLEQGREARTNSRGLPQP